MVRLMHETRETLVTLAVFACTAAGIFGGVFYTIGPDGWFSAMVQRLLLDPSLGALAAPVAVLILAVGGKRWLDRRPRSWANNVLVGLVTLAGFGIILHQLRDLLG